MDGHSVRLPGMNSFLDRLFQVWTDRSGLDELEDRLAAFYTDPVRVNGSDLSLADLATRARALHAAFSGPYETPVGIIQPAGADVQIRTIDVLTFTDEKISAVWVNADDLGMLRQLGWRP